MFVTFPSLCTITYVPQSPPSHNPPHLSLLADQCTSMHQLKQMHAQTIVRARIHDNYAASRVLSFCALSESGSLSYALTLFDHIKEPKSFMWNTLIRAQAGRIQPSRVLKDGRRVFNEVPERNLNIWTTMISKFAQNDRYGDAIQLVERMLADGMEPNGVTLASVLSACAQSGSLQLGEQIHAYMEENGIEVGVILGTALVNMYAKNGAIVEAKKCFSGMKESKIATWNAMICGLASHGHAKEAINFFKELEQEK